MRHLRSMLPAVEARLAITRMLIVITMAATLVLFVFAMPRLVPLLATPCTDVLQRCLVTPQQVAPLARLGVTPYALALGIIALSWLALLLVDGVAGVLLWRRSNDWMALLVALTLILMPLQFTPVLRGLDGIWHASGEALASASFPALLVLMSLFPSGRFVPRWIWLPVVASSLDLLFSIPELIGARIGETAARLLDPFVDLFIVGTLLALIAGQIYRYRRASTPIQRQQTKWAVAGLVLTLAVNQLFWQPGAWIPALGQPDSLYSLLLFPDSLAMICILAVSFGVAILRYRLYEIDVIIRRTLIYGSLTLVLAGVYVAGVVGGQALVNAMTHRPGAASSPILIVVTTLVMAALFEPLRRRIQRFIDRRFYRSKYNTRKTLETFGTTLRQEVDLRDLQEQLLRVVQETMQPAHVSLWLRPRIPSRKASPMRARRDSVR